MKNLRCLNDVITTDLALYIDISDDDSWNLNTGLTLVSLNKWKNAIAGDLSLPDFGLTAFDNGRVKQMSGTTLTITSLDTQVKLYRVGFNNATGGTFYTGLGITTVTGGTAPFVGKHFTLNGGYLQGFFKLKDYNFQLLPYRYINGITVETIVKITPTSFTNDGFLFLLGARSEDKYIPSFSGETGMTTSLGNGLNAIIKEPKLKNAIRDNILYETVDVTSVGDDIYDNVFGIQLKQEGNLAFSFVNSGGTFVSIESGNVITDTGWTIISMVFKPYLTIKDQSLLDCLPNRKGDFFIYVNGREFWKIENFEEFWFKGFDNHKEKQIGVPYNISWGGGSFGLKNSWHFNNGPTKVKDNRKNNLTIEKYFSQPFKGSIQKLRIYDNALSSVEILHNAWIEAKNNLGYGLTVSKGGRIINS